MRNLDQIIKTLPRDRQAKIGARAQKLIAEEMALRQLRQAHELTQAEMASLLETDQASVSKIEKRSDMLVSTMRSFIEAMGGKLRLLAEFPSGCVEVATFGEWPPSRNQKSGPRKPSANRRKSDPAISSACRCP